MKKERTKIDWSGNRVKDEGQKKRTKRDLSGQRGDRRETRAISRKREIERSQS